MEYPAVRRFTNVFIIDATKNQASSVYLVGNHKAKRAQILLGYKKRGFGKGMSVNGSCRPTIAVY